MKTYVLQSDRGGPIKIGKSKNPERRAKQIEGQQLDRMRVLVSVEGDQEFELHKRFSAHRIRNDREWFSLDVPVVRWLVEELGVSERDLFPAPEDSCVNAPTNLSADDHFELEVRRYAGGGQHLYPADLREWMATGSWCEHYENLHDENDEHCECEPCLRIGVATLIETPDFDDEIHHALYQGWSGILWISIFAVSGFRQEQQISRWKEIAWEFDRGGVELAIIFMKKSYEWKHIHPHFGWNKVAPGERGVTPLSHLPVNQLPDALKEALLISLADDVPKNVPNEISPTSPIDRKSLSDKTGDDGGRTRNP